MRSGAKQFEKKIAAKNSILNIILTLINHQIKSQVNFLEKTSFLLNIFLGKPNSQHDTADGEEDAEFLNIIHKVRVEPRKKYSEPITETQVKSYETDTYENVRSVLTWYYFQEYGWYSDPLVKDNWKDRRLRFAIINTEITKFKDAEWKMKEQMNINN